MLYNFIKVIARLALPVYCRNIQVNKKEVFTQTKGPLLLAVNHPNSFLDAIILCTLFKQPVYCLARGDAFTGKKNGKILKALNMLPVYRVSEGVKNLEENYQTFDACKQIFRRQGTVLIFSEGLCVNEWHLRSLKKGTARLALSSWEEGIPLRVLPVGINYQSFHTFGKNIQLLFGEAITADQIITAHDSPAVTLQRFNNKLRQQLEQLVFEIAPTDQQMLHNKFYIHQPLIKKICLLLPAMAGYLLHAPLYYPVKNLVIKKSIETDHFDSILIGIFFLIYPVYILLLTLITGLIIKHWVALFILVLMPFTAWSYVQVKRQF